MYLRRTILNQYNVYYENDSRCPKEYQNAFGRNSRDLGGEQVGRQVGRYQVGTYTSYVCSLDYNFMYFIQNVCPEKVLK